MNKIRILIVDDHKVVRTGLKALLSTEPGFEVVGEADDGTAALRETLALKPDVIIMDLMMAGMDGETATREILSHVPSSRIIVLTSYTSSDIIAHALEAGAVGAVLKTADDVVLTTAIRTVADGKRYLSPEVSRLMKREPPIRHLTPRQEEVLHSMTRGLTNAEIALQLGICEARVEEHISAILNKIDAANRTEAVAIALKKHLLKI